MFLKKKLLSLGNPAKSVLTALLCVVLNSEEKHRLHPGKSDSVCRRIVKLNIWTTRTYADRMANPVDPDQTAYRSRSGSTLLALACLSKNLGTSQYLKILCNSSKCKNVYISVF